MATVTFACLLAMLSVAVARVAPLANCPAHCRCDDDTLVVSCSEGHLEVLPIALNPSIQRLEIKKNKIRIVDSSLQFYSELSYLDLSHNRLFALPQRTFNYQKKLLELHLNHNQIGVLSNRTFHGLGTLTVLNLRSNELTALAAGTFAALANLQELNLGQNRIARIDERAFDGLAQLRVLYLDDNSLTAVPSTAFGAVPALAELFIGINQLGDSIQPGAFAALAALTRLELQGVRMRNLSLETFRGLENVRHLDLTGNRLQRIPTVELSSLARLEDLRLGQNEFRVIAEAAFVGMANLRRLDISGSPNLTLVESGAFSANTNLESVVLASNKKLAAVHEGAFSGLPHLRHVVLRDNALTTLGEGMFPWSQLATFDLAENPIHCDCNVIWLRNVLLAQNASAAGVHEQILCAAPEHMHNEPLRLLSADRLGCAHLAARDQAVLGLMLVSAAAVLTALLLVGWRQRAHIAHVLSGNWWTGKQRKDVLKTRHSGGAGDEYLPCTIKHKSVSSGIPYVSAVDEFHAKSRRDLEQQQLQQQQQHQYTDIGAAAAAYAFCDAAMPAHKVSQVHHINEHGMSVFQLSQDHLSGASNKAFSLFPHSFGTGGGSGSSAHPIAMQNAYTASPPHHHHQQQQQQLQQLPVESHYSSLQLEYDYAVAVHRNGHPHTGPSQRQHHHHHTLAPRAGLAPRPLGPAPALPARNGTVTLPKQPTHGAKRMYH